MCKEEAYAGLFQKTSAKVRTLINIYPKSLQAVLCAVPQWEEAARLPCFATFIPPEAATRAAVVEILKLWALSPPVPTISNSSISVFTGMACSRIAAAQGNFIRGFGSGAFRGQGG